MKKIISISIILIFTVVLTSCGVQPAITEEPTPSPTDTSAPPQHTPQPTPVPTPEPFGIEVILNNHHTRYYDDMDTQFDISVIGDFDDYEIVFVPIESIDNATGQSADNQERIVGFYVDTSEYAPVLDADGLPYGKGSYNVVVHYKTGNENETYESGIVVSIVNRPPILVQLSTPPGIPGQISFGEESLIYLNDDKTIETDYYIAHLKAGYIYSSWLFPLFDLFIDYVHEFTGLYLLDSGERFNLYFSYDGASGNIMAPGAGRDSTTGELVMYLYDGLVGIDTFDIYWYGFEKDSYMLSITDPYVFFGQAIHEFVHVLDFALTTNNPNRWSFVHGEGLATFATAILLERLIPEWLNTAEEFPLSVNFDIDLLYRLVHNRLEFMLSRDGGADFNSRTTGSIFYLYIYEEFGMEKVIEVFKAMSNRPSATRVSIANNILGVNITRAFPIWYDENVAKLNAIWG